MSTINEYARALEAENAELRAEIETGRAEWTRMTEEHDRIVGERDALRAAVKRLTESR